MSNNNLKIYEKYMKKAISIAKKGMGKTSPNPIVGAILLDKNLNFISEGYHQKYGEAHAEVNAINSALKKGIDIKGGTIIITLEPCSHYGKTPPCADLIINSGIKTVATGTLDPNKKVAGNGIKKCKNAGLTTIVGIMEKECKQLNEFFFKNQIKNLPFITIKTATTLDGKIATKTNSSKWITNEKARKDVQKLRNIYDAILTTSSTIITDNPSLNCRLKNGKNPTRIIVDSNAITSENSKVFNNDGTKILLVTTKKTNKYPKNVEILIAKEKNSHVDLEDMFKKLYQKGICSILVEAGGTFNGSLIKEKLADKLIKYTAPKILGDKNGKTFAEGFSITNINNCTMLELTQVKQLEDNIRTDFYFKYD